MRGFIVTLLIAITCCFVCLCHNQAEEPKYMSGFVVAKEYTPAHMDNEEPKSVSCAAIFVPTFHPAPMPSHHTPVKIEEQWVIFVANRFEVYAKWTSKDYFKKVKLGQFITIKK